jgi:OFA family oxalate/formate antiporter-like MFS transporter
MALHETRLARIVSGWRGTDKPETNGSISGQQVKRLFVLPAVVLIQSCLGGLYAWSAFVPSLRADFGYTAGQTQLVFGLAIAAFTLAMVFAGRLLVPWGPRRVALLGGLLFACGHLTSSASAGQFVWLLTGSGLLGGVGIGFGYVAALTTGMQWFPCHKGFVAGVAVAGFGAGAIILSSLTTVLLRNGYTVMDIFQVIGLGYGALVCLASASLFRPPCAAGERGHLDLKYVLKDRVFRALATGIFCGTFAGLLVIGSLKPIGMDGGSTSGAATAAISLFALGNASGRLAWGWLFDRFGYSVIPLSLMFLGATLTLLLVARLAPAAFAASAFFVGFGFGACFVLYAAQVALRYGAEQVASVYPLVFLAHGVAGITGPPLGGYLYDCTRSYVWALVAGIAVLAFGAWRTFRVRSVRLEPSMRRIDARAPSRLN